MMEFDKSRVYTTINAGELKVGSKVIVADSLAKLKEHVESTDQSYICTIAGILPENMIYRISAQGCEWALAYLISEPEEKKLKWTDLKIGDVVRTKATGIKYLVTGIDRRDEPKDNPRHVFTGGVWLDDEELEDYEKEE